jgi:hypothetical protein
MMTVNDASLLAYVGGKVSMMQLLNRAIAWRGRHYTSRLVGM